MALIGAAIALCLISIVAYSIVNSSRRSTPKGFDEVPGPKGAWLVGNTFQIPQVCPQLKFIEWSKQYGEIFRIQMGWNDWYFIQGDEAVKAILDRQASATSSRPPQPVLSDVHSGGMRFLLMPYAERWRRLRAMVHQFFTPKATELFLPAQEFEAKQLVYDVAHNPEDFYSHFQRYTTSVVMTTTYGKRIPSWEENEDVRGIYRIMKDFSDGIYLADLIPPLAKIPRCLQWWRPFAERAEKRQRDLWLLNWRALRAKVENGNAPECFVKQLMMSAGADFSDPEEEVQAAFLAGSLLEAGSETTSLTALNAILELMDAPSVVAQAHVELDRVVPADRSPTFKDDLPMIRAISKETLRLHPVATIGSPRYTTKPITYKNYYIPANAILTLNQWGSHYDELKYPNHLKFDPSRFVTSHPNKSPTYVAINDFSKRDNYSWGVGRRICLGLNVAENSLFIILAKILWAFDIQRMDPDTPSARDLIGAYIPGTVPSPKPFKARFIPREGKLEILDREWAEAKAQGYTLGSERINA